MNNKFLDAKHDKIIEANVIIKTEFIQPDDKDLIFSGEPCLEFDKADLAEILVQSGIFISKGQARKTGHIQWLNDAGEWDKKTPVKSAEIPPGFSEFISGKLRHRVMIWNPSA